MKTVKLLMTAAALLLATACSDSDVRIVPAKGLSNDTAQNDGTSQAVSDIVTTATENGSFTTLVAALQATGLDTVLADEQREFTVFAPTDEAFDALGQETVNALLADTETLSDILLYHVIADQTVDAETAVSLAGNSVEMANGDSVNLSLDGIRLFINDSEVTVTDVQTSNGVIHVIDKVLLPPENTDDPAATDAPTASIVDTAVSAGNLNTLAAALEATGLTSVLADENRTFTVFAPTDAAFDALGQETVDALLADPDKLRDILLYHVLPDTEVDAATATSLAGSTVTSANGDALAITLQEGKLFINTSEVIGADVRASNGIIHLIDKVLLPPADEQPPVGTIVEVAAANGSFTTLVAALQATGLDATLANPDAQFTVFAPTDEAFDKLGEDTINALLADPDRLSNILLYHVISNQVVDSTTAISLAGNQVTMSNGDNVLIAVDGDQLLVNQSRVVTADVGASNGVIHAIDTVLLPPATDASSDQTLLDILATDGNFDTLYSLVKLTGLDSALGHPDDTYTLFAPTDAAFNSLGQETLSQLLGDPETLTDILRYHLVAGNIIDSMTAQSLIGVSIEAANGDRISLSESMGKLFVNTSEITQTDIRGVNGVIHVIDAVLVPGH